MNRRQIISNLKSAIQALESKVSAASEESLEYADPNVISILESVGYKPTDYWEGVHGNIINATNLKTKRDGSKLSSDKMKRLLKIPGLRWVDAAKDSISIGF